MTRLILERLKLARTTIEDSRHWFQGLGHARDSQGRPVIASSPSAVRWNVPGAAARAAFREDLPYPEAMRFERELFHYVTHAADDLGLRLDDLERSGHLSETAAHLRDLSILDHAYELAEKQLGSDRS